MDAANPVRRLRVKTVLQITVAFGLAVAACTPTPRVDDSERSIRAFDENYDEPFEKRAAPVRQNLAQAACTALYHRRGWVLAVPRGCGTATCDQICDSIWDDHHTKDLQCIIPIHVYGDNFNPPATENNKKGLKTFIYREAECDEPRNCAPNYCCCASTTSQS